MLLHDPPRPPNGRMLPVDVLMWWMGMWARLLAASGTTYANLIVVCCCCADVDLRAVVDILKKAVT